MDNHPKNKYPIEIDGSIGEGGGQVLRTALALSITTRQAFVIENIRANRKKPGLRPQHLKAVEAARLISQASVDGNHIGSSRISFNPKSIKTGRYKVDIGTAGSTSLVLQTIYMPLSLANSSTTISITGGTHVPWSPCYHYLILQWWRYLSKIGFDIALKLEKAGYYPQGGGRITATIRKASMFSPLQLTSRGDLIRIRGVSGVSNLPLSIANRQKRQAMTRLYDELSIKDVEIKIKQAEIPAYNKGTFLLLLAEFENGSACYYGLGELGKPAEKVADEATDKLIGFFHTGGAIDEYLADQLLLPLSTFRDASMFTTNKISNHLLTNAAVISKFLPVHINVQGELGREGLVRIIPEF